MTDLDVGAAREDCKLVPSRELDALIPVLYKQLLRIARSHMTRERPNHELCPSALVHESYLRLVHQRRLAWRDQDHFLALASKMMGRVLIDHARKATAFKRGGRDPQLSFDDAVYAGVRKESVELHAAVIRLSVADRRQALIVELRFFGGLTIADTSRVLGVSPATVKNHWVIARRRLHSSLTHLH
jgi:RNA polymerase sigma factor (TIGR02999 family)